MNLLNIAYTINILVFLIPVALQLLGDEVVCEQRRAELIKELGG